MGLLNDKQSNILFAVVLLIGLYLVFKIFRGIGLIKSVDEEKREKEAGLLLNTDWLKPQFYTKEVARVKKNGKTFDAKKYFPNLPYFRDYAARIWNSKGFFKDNESEAIGVMKSFISKAEASLFADYFNKTYKRDLTTFFETYMSADQLSIIYNVVKPLRSI